MTNVCITSHLDIHDSILLFASLLKTERMIPIPLTKITQWYSFQMKVSKCSGETCVLIHK